MSKSDTVSLLPGMPFQTKSDTVSLFKRPLPETKNDTVSLFKQPLPETKSDTVSLFKRPPCQTKSDTVSLFKNQISSLRRDDGIPKKCARSASFLRPPFVDPSYTATPGASYFSEVQHAA